MDIVVLLGAGAEPAQSIARRLVSQGSRVYGLAHKFPEQGFAHRDFVPVGVNPADPAAVREAVERIISREGAVGAVILAGHSPVEDAFESAHPHDVALAVFAGLAAPLSAVRAAMPGLVRRRGLVMAITRPVFGPGAALGGVVEAGLSAFCEGIFAELRDTGVRVCHLRLQENPGAGDAASRYTNAPQSRIQPDIVADTVEAVMRLRENNAITRLVVRPQATREEPRLPVTSEPRLASLQVVQLPTSRNYPAPEDKILTPEYRRPDYAPPPEAKDDDEDDEGDDAVDPELAYLIKPRHRDRFVRETPPREDRREERRAESGEWSDGGPEGETESGEESADQEAESRREEPRREDHRREERRHDDRRDHRDHRGYDPRHPHLSAQQHGRDNRPPKNGALRIQPPTTSESSDGRPPEDRRPQPSQPAPRDRQENFRNGDNRPHRPYEQMPRPKGWQGPRLPQPQHIAQGGAPRPPQGGDRRDGRFERPAPVASESASPEAAPSASESPAEVPSAPAPVPVVAPPVEVPVAPVAPVVIPVITPHESDRNAEAVEKSAGSGRSEAVTLSFTPAAVAKPVAELTPEPIAAPVADSEPDSGAAEDVSGDEEKPKRKTPGRKPTKPKAAKAESAAEESGETAPEPDDEAKPAKPKRGRPPKKSV